METIIVLSHLRWNFVYQRPQQLFSRLAERYQVVFFEEPVLTDGVPFIEVTHPLPNLRVGIVDTSPLTNPSFQLRATT